MAPVAFQVDPAADPLGMLVMQVFVRGPTETACGRRSIAIVNIRRIVGAAVAAEADC